MSLDGLTAEERAAADAAVARLRAERHRDPVGDLAGLIERPGETPDEQLDRLTAERDDADGEDFDRFWSSRSAVGKVLRNVRGVDLQLPAELPLAFEIHARRLENDRSVAAVHRLFSLLFGENKLAELIERGLGSEQLSVLLMWGSANGNGRDMTLAEAEAAFRDLRAQQAAGKALVPPVSGGTSSGAGRSSNPTSPASTRSRKKRSRR